MVIRTEYIFICRYENIIAQACKALQEEGYRVILVNSNPATIMTDPDMADAIYIEPIEWRTVAKIIEKEKPDALLPTMGGQTALNCALDLVREGEKVEKKARVPIEVPGGAHTIDYGPDAVIVPGLVDVHDFTHGGEFVCTSCEGKIHLKHPGRIPPCPKCTKTEFKRS